MTHRISDLVVSILLLLFSAVMINDSSNIRDLGFDGMKADFWPKIVLWLLVIMSSILFGKSFIFIKNNPAISNLKIDNKILIISTLIKFKNAFICFAMFMFFLLTLDYLGMLIGGVLFVFGLLTFLGNFNFKSIVKHFLISIISIGCMWAIFTYGLKVMLPEGEILNVW